MRCRPPSICTGPTLPPPRRRSDVRGENDVGTTSQEDLHDTLTVNRSGFGRTISLYSGSDELVTRFSTEGAAALTAFQTDLTTALQLAGGAGVGADTLAALQTTADT